MRALILALCLATPAAASSEASWESFRADVDTACRALVTEPGEVAVEVDPFGSVSYGAALVAVTSGAGTARYICIYDKAAKTAELSSGLPAAAP